ncbi:hypothetical protein EYC80_001419 [Monilinia laxa]|uniref:Uncharacterized protein n=1 Tax=Monilinia laxa TaxID=61186 RepID=A0A5N6K978_MONLA|nr:hypothetical protein EYC80_001419 [Monilinia laxa]
MVGAPASESLRLAIDYAMHLLQKMHEESLHEEPSTSTQPPLKRRKTSSRSSSSEPSPMYRDRFPTSSIPPPPLSNPIPRVSSTDLNFTPDDGTPDPFSKHMHQPRDCTLGAEPLIITHSIITWPALNQKPWSSPSYLLTQTINGRRLIPIEIGRSYVDPDWGQKITTFKTFLTDYMLSDPTSSTDGQKTGYLAQHNLFAQIPTLRSDISIPDYCHSHPHHHTPAARLPSTKNTANHPSTSP